MPAPRALRNSSLTLAAVAVVVGAGVGTGLVVAAVYTYPFPGYFSETVTVPADATPSNPYVVAFDGATFTMSWPTLPSGIYVYSEEFGVDFNITEPSGVLVEKATDCTGDCNTFLKTWYSGDAAVGIGWHDNAFDDPALLVRA